MSGFDQGLDSLGLGRRGRAGQGRVSGFLEVAATNTSDSWVTLLGGAGCVHAGVCGEQGDGG